MDATLEELSVQQETEDQNYGIFLEMMEARSRGHASPLVANGQSPSSGSQSPVVPPGAVSTGSSSPGTPQPAPQLPLNAAPHHPLCPCTTLRGPAATCVLPSAPASGAASSRGCLGRHLPPRQPLHLQSQSWPPRPQQQCRAWRTSFPTTAWTAASWKMQPPPGTRRRWGPRLPSRTATVMRRPWAATRWWQGSRTMWTSKTSHVGVPHHPLVPSPVRTSLFQVRRKQKWWIPQKALPRLPSSAQSQRPRSSTPASKPRRGTAPTRAAAPPRPGGASVRTGPEKHSSTRPPAEIEPGKGEQASSSESDPEGPIAAQMLSFVMDDPDFESEASDTQRRVDEFPVRDDPSDVTDEDEALAQPPPPPKLPLPTFRLKNDSDLFGLGLEEAGPKESSEEGKEGKTPSKEKKKKKKGKEQEEKAAKKKSKHKKSKDKEEGKEERRRRQQRPPRSRERTAADELEAFLGGGPYGRHPGGGDYEEL
uniref:RAB, member RAS oncogene family like 6 n=1 Tax=Macaca fascicularis TaxID=9541 RepID=A0A2K5VE09_MACFA